MERNGSNARKMNLRLAKTGRRLRQLSRSTRGSAAIEFAMVAPALFYFLFGIIEVGVIFFAGAMLQNATDDTARRIRTGQLSGALTATQLVSDICSEVDGLISSNDCNANLKVDLRSYTTFGSSSYPTVTNPDGSLNTGAMKVQATADCSVVLMRSYYSWSIMTPLLSSLLQSMPGGKYLLASAASFRTEPYTSSSTC
jgi:Flp pilus assembly protein TadG